MESKESTEREEQKGKGEEKTSNKGRDDQEGERNNKEAIHTQAMGNRGGPLGKEGKGNEEEKDGDKENRRNTRHQKQPREGEGEDKKGIG